MWVLSLSNARVRVFEAMQCEMSQIIGMGLSVLCYDEILLKAKQRKRERERERKKLSHSGRTETKIGYRVLWFIWIANKTATPAAAEAASSRTTIPKQTWKFGYGNVYYSQLAIYTIRTYTLTKFALKSHLQQISMRLEHSTRIRIGVKWTTETESEYKL